MAPSSDSTFAARAAFDEGPWPRLTHAQRAEYLQAFAAGLTARADDLGQIWPRQSSVLHRIAKWSGMGAAGTFSTYAAMADTFPFEEPATPTAGGTFGLLVREPVGVVGAIVPWNAPIGLISKQGCSGAPRRVHCRVEGLSRGARRGLRRRRDRRVGRVATRCAQRAHCRP